MIYGPGDPLHRFHPTLKRIGDGRKQIIFSDDVATIRTPRGYVEDVGAAIALAATPAFGEAKFTTSARTSHSEN